MVFSFINDKSYFFKVFFQHKKKRFSPPLAFVLIFVYICRPEKKVYFVVVLRGLLYFNMLFVNGLSGCSNIVDKISFGK
jgi:hypothetical protein